MSHLDALGVLLLAMVQVSKPYLVDGVVGEGARRLVTMKVVILKQRAKLSLIGFSTE